MGRDERLVSHQVRQLKAAGLALSQREGKMVMYELTDLGSGLLAAVAAREGCCVSSPLDGAGFADDACRDDCCTDSP